MPRDREPDQLVGDVLTMLLPPDVELDREEDKLKALRDELAKIEGKLRGYVEAIRNNVDADIPRPDPQAAEDQRHPLQPGIWQGAQGVSRESARARL